MQSLTNTDKKPKKNFKCQLGLMQHFRRFKRFCINVIKPSINLISSWISLHICVHVHMQACLHTCMCVCVFVMSVPSVLPGGLALAVSELIQGAAEGA